MSTTAKLKAAVSHLRRVDPVMKGIIKEVGPCMLRPRRDRFEMLVGSIISQQISTGAARSIKKRLAELCSPQGISAPTISQYSVAQLRSAGVSPQKAKYLLDLAAKVEDGSLTLTQIGRLSDEAVIEQLTSVRGIGHWTAQMFLIFSLGRLDVFPHGDLGVRNAIRHRYGLEELPDKETSCTIAEPWSPYASVASWYCWRSLELG